MAEAPRGVRTSGWSVTHENAAEMRTGQRRLINETRPGGKGGGLPAFRPTDEHRQVVSILASNGVSQRVMAQVIGCSEPTLTKYFRKEIDDGYEIVCAHVGAVVVREALAGNIPAARYWLSLHGGERWRLPKELAGKDLGDGDGGDDVVHFYMPPNGRDEPEREEPPPTIDGEVTPKTGTDDA